MRLKKAPQAWNHDAVPMRQVAKDGDDDLVVGYNRVAREAREAVYKAVAKFPATTMHTQRTELSEEARRTLQKALDASDPGVWTITNVNVRNLVTDPALERAIRDRAAVDQRIAQAQKEIELEQAEAERKRVKASGDARANEIVAASITPGLLRLKEIEASRAFAGSGTHTVVLGGNSGAQIHTR